MESGRVWFNWVKEEALPDGVFSASTVLFQFYRSCFPG